ncbi:uncharacterized protein LOC144863345 [Branchiostoma floridae x Branchiostoma japonicum]
MLRCVVILLAALHVALGQAPRGSYKVTDQKSGDTCIRADLSLTFDVKYQKQDSTTGTATFSLPPDGAVTGTCDPAVLNVTNPGRFGFSATFTKLAPLGIGRFWLKKLEVQYYLLPDLFPDVSSETVNKSMTERVTLDSVLFVTKYGDSYLCNKPEIVPIQDNVRLTFADVQLQPFDLKNGTFSTAQECTGEPTPSPPVTTPGPPVTTPLPLSDVGHFNVTDKKTGAVCILARLGAMFSIQYKTNVSTQVSITTFTFSPQATASGSCGKNASVISLLDKRGVNLTAEFGVNANGLFMVTKLTIVYTQTETLFPYSKHPNTTKTESSPEHILLAPLGRSYRCNSSTPVQFGSMVNATFFGLKVQPFEVKNNTFGDEDVCSADLPHTTPEPTTHPHTTPHPNVTTPMPTTSPPRPPEGTWSVRGKDGKPCLLADAAIQLRIPYNSTGNETRTAFIDVPRTASAGGVCGANNSSLNLHFKPGNVTLQLGFRKEGEMKTDFVLWSVGVAYNEDPAIFKNTSSPGRRVRLENKSLKEFETKLGMTYKCVSKVVVPVNRSVEVEFRNTTLQPFGVEGGKFANESVCPEDRGHTTPLPHTNHTTPLPHTNNTTPLPHTNNTTPLPHTNHTTPLPHTNHTTAPPHKNHTTPHPHTKPPHTKPHHTIGPPLFPPEPKQGNYTVTGKDKKPCILANMGIQFHIKYTKTDNKQAVARFNAPTSAVVTGVCGQDRSTLTLGFYQNTISLTFEFTKSKMGSKGTESFRAETIDLSYKELQAHFPDAKDPGQVRQASNKSAHAFYTEAGHSYKCMADYNLTLTKDVEILVRKVHLQPFSIQDGKFSSAHECSLDPKPSSPGHSAAIAAGIIVPLVVVIAAAAGFYLYRRRKLSGKGKGNCEPLLN